MIRILPFILIPVLIIGGLGYWRFVATKPSPSPATEASQTVTSDEIMEVPKTLPADSVEIRVKSLEDKISKLAPSPIPNNTLDTRLKAAEGSITDLTARISALEKSDPAQSSTNTSPTQSTIYIPLGSVGTVSSVDWSSLNTFQVSLDPAQYPGYKSMQLEVNMRLNQPGGTLYARLYNSSSSSATSSEVSSTSTSSGLYSSSAFTLSSGNKTYVLQAKTTDGSQSFLDTARIRVNF